MADVFCEEYASSLNELTFNSKPHISMLTMLAEENSQYAPQIVKSIEAHLQKVKPEAKLPTLYLIDSIIKNVGHNYLNLFTQNLVSNFCNVFEKVDEKIRAQMYKLRQTWADIFPNKKLYAIDVRVKELDPAWPINAQPPPQQSSAPATTIKYHVNPKFLKVPTTGEDTSNRSVQDLDGELVRQKLIAKQQEMVRLQREKLELELIQTQNIVEEQKRQLILHEQRLRNQQSQSDLQKKITLHQLSKMGIALPTNPNLQLDSSNLNQHKVDVLLDSKEEPCSKVPSSQAVATATTSINSKNSVNFSQAVISSLMSVSNKTIDANPLIMQGLTKSVDNKNQPEILSNSFQASSQLLTNVSHLKSVVQQPIVGKSSLETSVHKNFGSAAPNLEGKSDGVGLKTSPKLRSDKNEKDKNSSSKSKSPSSKKRSTSSTSKSKEEDLSKSKVGDGFKANSSKDSTSNKVNARSKSSSLSPSKSRSSGKSKQWSPNSSSTRRTSNPSRSRSPSRREKNRERDDRGSKRDRRSPRRDKENDSRSKSSSFTKDSSKQDDEPPYKKSKPSDSELDEIFGGKDQDYRQMDRADSKSPHHSSDYQGWAQYKASRPDQFKSAMRSRDGNDHRDSFNFGKQDLDLRTSTNLPVRGKLPTPWLPYRIPKINQAKGGRLMSGPTVHPRMDPRLLAQGTSNYYQTTRESDPSIPRALMFDHGPEIMKQADSQLRSGQLTVEQHREIMEQLAKLYELQRTRHMQREQHMRESIISQRNDLGQHQDVIASSPEGSPRSESEISKPVKSNSSSVESEALKNNVSGKETKASSGKTETNAAAVENKKNANEVHEDEISIILEAKRELKEKPAIEVVISDDEEEVVKKRRLMEDSMDSEKQQSKSSSKSSSKSMPNNTVMIDDQPREVKFFGSTAIVILENNDPREIAFRGPPQEIMIGKQLIRLGFNNEQKEFEFENVKHTITFGAPTRELFIDGNPHCAVFGGPPVTITLDGKSCELRLCGPTPEVFFGDKPRHDILPKVLEREAEERQSARQQQQQKPPFIKSSANERSSSPSSRWGSSNKGNRDYDSREWRSSNHDDGFQRGANNRDDWPMSQQLRGSSRFNDETFRPDRNGPYRDDQRGPPILPRGPDAWPRREDQRGNFRGPIPPMRGEMMPEPGGRMGNSNMNEYFDEDDGRNNGQRPRSGGYYMDARYNHGGPGQIPPQMRRHIMPSRFDESGMPMRPMQPHGMGGPPHPMGPMPPGPMKYRPQFMNYPRMNHHERFSGPPHPEFGYMQNQPHAPPSGFNPPAVIQPPALNVNELFDKLVSTGIIPQATNTNTTAAEPTKSEEEPEKPSVTEEKVPPIELTSDSLKIKRPSIHGLLYSGIQCQSCGVRFTLENNDKYGQHLDWHFRQNRREKDSARKPLSRKWYYDVQDWVQFEEIEDLEERARSFFEIQTTEDQNEETEDNGPSVPAGEIEEDKKCAVCRELFELYWDEEHEEWHFRDAIRKDDKNYHPLCYEDFKEQSAFVEEPPALKDEPMAEETTIQDSSNNVGEISESAEVIKKEPEAIATEESEEQEKLTIESNEVEVKSDADETSSTCIVKEEPMETENENNQSEGNNEGIFSVFNVLSTSYTVPPLLMWESEEPSDSVDEDQKIKTELEESKEEVMAQKDACVEESENVVSGSESDDSETESSSDEDTSDLIPVEECEYPLISSKAESEVDEQETSDAQIPTTTLEDLSISANVINHEPTKEEQDDSLLNNKQITVGENSIINDNPIAEDKFCENVLISDDNIPPQMSLIENIVKESEPLFATHLLSVRPTTSGDDDIVLKESSDVVSDFSFETSGLDAIEESDPQTQVTSPVAGKDEEDSDEEINLNEELAEEAAQFSVQPIVNKGTEVSGLCSIM